MADVSSDNLKTITLNGKEYPVLVCPRGASGHTPMARVLRPAGTVGVYLPNRTKPEPYRMTYQVARDLRNQGMAEFINRKCDIRLKKAPTFKRSDACIRIGEIYANAGLYGHSRTARMSESRRQELLLKGQLKREEDFVERSQAKIEAWGQIGDIDAVRFEGDVSGRAVTIVAGKVARPNPAYLKIEQQRSAHV